MRYLPSPRVHINCAQPNKNSEGGPRRRRNYSHDNPDRFLNHPAGILTILDWQGGRQLRTHQLDVVAERAGVVHPVPLTPHHLQKVIEGGLVIVEYKNVLSSIDKLLNRVFIPGSQLGIFIRRCAKTTFFSFSKELLTTYITPRKCKNSSQLSLELTNQSSWQFTCITRSWHRPMNWFSVWTIVWRNLRYWKTITYQMLISSGGKQFRAETWLRGQPCVACSDQPMNYYCGDIKYQTVRQPQPQQDPAFVPPKVRWENLINPGSDKLWWPTGQAGKNIRKPKLFWTLIFWHFEI